MGANILVLTDATNFLSYGDVQAIRAFGTITGEASPFVLGTDKIRKDTLEKRAALFDLESCEWVLEGHEEKLAKQAPIAVALLTSKNFKSLEDLPRHFAQAVRATPIVLFAARRGKYHDRAVLDNLAALIVAKNHQAKAWIDVSIPENGQVVHHTWPHELPLSDRPTTVAKLSTLDNSEAADGAWLPDNIHGSLALEIDVAWAGEATKTRGFVTPQRRKRTSNSAENSVDEKRARASSELLQYLGHKGASVIVTISNVAPNELHEKLALLTELPNVFWREKTPGPPLSEVTAKLDPEKLAAVERWLGLVTHREQHGSSEIVSPEEQASIGLKRLVQGQIASLSRNRPIDEKDFDHIIKKADQDLSTFATALKAQTLESLKVRDAPKAILSHLGTEKDCLRQNDRTPIQDIIWQWNKKTTSSKFKLELKPESGWPIVQKRIQEVAAGIAVAHCELLRLHWLRFIKPYLTEHAERLAEHPEDYPAIPVFDPSSDGFTNKIASRIEDTLVMPPPVEVNSVFSAKPLVTTVKQLVRKSPMYLAMLAAALTAFGVKEDATIPVGLVGVCISLVIIGYCAGLYWKNKEDQDAKRDAYLKAIEGSIRTKLGEILNEWSDYVAHQRNSFFSELRETLHIQARNASADDTGRSKTLRTGLEQRLSDLEERIAVKVQAAEGRQRELKDASSGLYRIAEKVVKEFEKER